MTTVDEHELRHHARQLRDAYLELHQLKGLHPPRPEARVMRATPGPRDPGNPIATYTWIHLETNLREVAHNAFREAGIRIHAADNNAPRLCELIAYHAQPISGLDWASDIIDELGEEHRIIHNRCHPDEPITIAQLAKRKRSLLIRLLGLDNQRP